MKKTDVVHIVNGSVTGGAKAKVALGYVSALNDLGIRAKLALVVTDCKKRWCCSTKEIPWIRDQESNYVTVLGKKNIIRQMGITDAKKLHDLVKSSRVVHLHGLRDSETILAAKIAKKQGIPYVITTHGALSQEIYETNGVQKIIRRVYDTTIGRYILSGAAAILALNPLELKNAEKLTGGLSKTCLVPNGVSEDDFKYGNKKEVLGKYGLVNTRYIITVARVHPEKGQEQVVKALKYLDDDLVYVIVGKDQNHLSTLLQIARKNKVTSRVKYLGEKFGITKQTLVRNASTFVLPSRREGFPLVIVEAMAQGQTPVVSDIPSNTWAFENDEVVPFELDNIKDLASAIDYAIAKTPKNRKRQVETAKRFLWKNIVKKYYIPIIEKYI